jgi:hypothetical protein
MKSILLLFFSIIQLNIYTLSNIKHDYFISSTNIEHNKTTKSLEITSSFFTDDLEKAIEQEYQIKLYLGTKKEHKSAEEYLGKYFKEYLKLTVDGKKVNFDYLGKEIEAEKTYNYIEVLNVPSLKTIQINSQMLFNVSKKQENMFHIKNAGKSKSLILYYERQTGEISF